MIKDVETLEENVMDVSDVFRDHVFFKPSLRVYGEATYAVIFDKKKAI